MLAEQNKSIFEQKLPEALRQYSEANKLLKEEVDLKRALNSSVRKIVTDERCSTLFASDVLRAEFGSVVTSAKESRNSFCRLMTLLVRRSVDGSAHCSEGRKPGL